MSDEIFKIIEEEKTRQRNVLRLIPSENYVSKAVLKALGSPVVNKYSEGEVGKRYYQGNKNIDKIELLAKSRALNLFDLDSNKWSVNVKAPSGTVANLAVYFALLEIGDPILSMSLLHGGHLSHGWKLESGKSISMVSKIFKTNFYGVSRETDQIDFKKLKTQAQEIEPKIIISGGTAYPREVDHEKFAKIAEEVGAYYLADVSHEAGLIASGVNSSPFPHADVVTMTTRKTLRGPVGALIFSKKEFSSKIDKTLFPGLQGGPVNNHIAGIAVSLGEASREGFKNYSKKVIENAKTLGEKLKGLGFDLVGGRTDKHLLLIDLSNKEIDGWSAALALEEAGIIVNRNTVPFDKRSPYYPSGIRLGTPAVTSRGMRTGEMERVAQWLDRVVSFVQEKYDVEMDHTDRKVRTRARKEFKEMMKEFKELKEIKKEVEELCLSFPAPGLGD